MKKVACLLALSASITLSLMAEAVFVTSKLCPLQSEPVSGSKIQAMLPMGDKLEVLQKKADWVDVKSVSATGWVRAMFVGSAAPIGKVPTSNDIQNISSVVQRRRADSFSTSGATTRGLSSGDTRARENLSFSNYDFEAVKWLTSIRIDDKEQASFSQELGLTLPSLP